MKFLYSKINPNASFCICVADSFKKPLRTEITDQKIMVQLSAFFFEGSKCDTTIKLSPLNLRDYWRWMVTSVFIYADTFVSNFWSFKYSLVAGQSFYLTNALLHRGQLQEGLKLIILLKE